MSLLDQHYHKLERVVYLWSGWSPTSKGGRGMTRCCAGDKLTDWRKGRGGEEEAYSSTFNLPSRGLMKTGERVDKARENNMLNGLVVLDAAAV